MTKKHFQLMTNNIGAIRLPVNRLHIELTNICNFSCEFCPDSRMKRRKGSMSFETAKSILDDASKSGIAKMVLFHVMGEPTLHPHLVEIVEYANKKRLETCLTTNGSRLDEKLLDELINAGVGRIIVSLQTPDQRTFPLRGARGITFQEYEDGIVSVAKKFLSCSGKTKLTLSFLSSPLRRLIIPIYPEVSIADTSSDLKEYLTLWYEKITGNSSRLMPLEKIWTFKENTINISDRLDFHTRILGDWSVHFDRKNVDARFGFCHGIQDNFGILWNGDYTFCCTDYDGGTSTHNFGNTSLKEYLESGVVQGVVKGFNKFRVVHPYCRQCLGDRSLLNTMVKQIGSIVYFKWMRKNSF